MRKIRLRSSRSIAVLGFWSILFGIMVLFLPLATVLPANSAGGNISVLNTKAITTAFEDVRTFIATVRVVPASEKTAAIPAETVREEAPPPAAVPVAKETPASPQKAELAAQPAMALSVDETPEGKLPATVKVGSSAGDLATDFTLSSFDGQKVALNELRGKKVVLNFWSTTCGACIVQFPVIRAVYVEHNKNRDDVAVITVCIDGTPERVKKIEERYSDKYGPLDFPILLAEQTPVAQSYGIWATPETFFLDQRGIIKRVTVGRFETPQEIEAILKSR